jgi:hypothetical protein
VGGDDPAGVAAGEPAGQRLDEEIGDRRGVGAGRPRVHRRGGGSAGQGGGQLVQRLQGTVETDRLVVGAADGGGGQLPPVEVGEHGLRLRSADVHAQHADHQTSLR